MSESDALNLAVAQMADELAREIDEEIIDTLFDAQVDEKAAEEAIWLLENYLRELCGNVSRSQTVMTAKHRGWHLVIRMTGPTSFRISEILDEDKIFRKLHNWQYRDLYVPESLDIVCQRVGELLAVQSDAERVRLELRIDGGGSRKCKW